MSLDSFKSHMSYPTNYFFGLVQQILPDGRALGIAVQDGIGSDITDKSNEDFLSLDGKIYKLGVTRVREDPSNLMSIKNLAQKGNQQQAYCELTYTPAFAKEFGFSIVVLAFKQEATYGYYKGTCFVEE